MFTSPAPAAPTLSTSTSPASPSSPTRSGRLRGLSYLRSYTHNHLHPHSSSHAPSSPTSSSARPSLARSRTSPNAEPTHEPPSRSRHSRENSATTSTARRAAPESATSISSATNPSAEPTSGWLPSTSRTALSRVTTRPPAIETGASNRVDPAPNTTSARLTVNPPSTSMARNRAESASAATASVVPTPAAHLTAPVDTRSEALESPGMPLGGATPNKPSIRLIPHHDPRAPRPSLSFAAITRTLNNPDTVIRVGRYSERENKPEQSATAIGFKSKVVSRKHCELWCSNSQWYVKDVKSSSGTFLNHIRLSQPGVESKPFALSDGDIIQLGIDFRGGEEMIFRCVKIRVECNRGWQKGLNNFNKSAHKHLRNLGKVKDVETASTHTSECSICLMSIAPCQSLFVAPCSHVWHYKCIRPILNGSTWPNFLCPNCRAVADLEADVDEPVEIEDGDEAADESLLGGNNHSEVNGETTRIGGIEGSSALLSSPLPNDRSTLRSTETTTRNNASPQVTDMMAATSLHDEEDASGFATPDEEESDEVDDHDTTHAMSTSSVAPIPIGSSRSPRPEVASSSSDRARSPSASRALGSTPSNQAPYALAANENHVHEGPMTPRNDHGPFVLDGSGTRNQRSVTIGSLDGIAHEPSRHDDTDSS